MPARHMISFILVGLGSFVVDVGLLILLSRGLGLSPFIARIPAVGVAMAFGWICNRTFTFRPPGPPSFWEFLRYVAASGLASLINYATFAAILIVWPNTALSLAAFAGAVVAAGVSYGGYRFFAFRH